MATIRTAISLYDGVSGPLRTMHRAMNVVMDSFEALNTASSGAINVSSIRQARAELSGVMSDFARTEEQIRNADDAQNELNSSIRGGSSAADLEGCGCRRYHGLLGGLVRRKAGCQL